MPDIWPVPIVLCPATKAFRWQCGETFRNGARHPGCASLWCAGIRRRTRPCGNCEETPRSCHGGTRRPPFPQRSGRAGDRDRRQGIHVRGRDAAVTTIRMSSSTWARTTRSSAPIARRSTASTPTLDSHAAQPAAMRLAAFRRRLNEIGTFSHGACASCHRRRRRYRRPDGGASRWRAPACASPCSSKPPKLEETGAGIQLSPNASRVLIALGLRERLEAAVVAPKAIRVMAGGSGREIVRIPLGDDIERRYGAPYWSIHRGDLQLRARRAWPRRNSTSKSISASTSKISPRTSKASACSASAARKCWTSAASR